MKIFLDLDGVLVDFIQGAASLFGTDSDSLLRKWPPGVYEMEEALGISRTKFFATLEAAGEEFWVNLPPFPYARDFYDHCTNIAPTYILTAPTRDPKSLSGKMRWLQNWFGQGFRDYVITDKKEMCARDTHVLIDDRVSNVDKFREHGGQAIMWPARQNPRWAEAWRALELVTEELEEVKSKICTGRS